MVSKFSSLSLSLLAACFVAVMGSTSEAQVTSGFNLGLPPGPAIPVDFDADDAHWVLEDIDLIFDPVAPPMLKDFLSPTQPSGGPLLLDGTQPVPFPVWENFFLVPGQSQAVSDWHEEILTPGWEWLPLPTESLITRDGEPWPSTPIPMPGGPDPTKIWVKFPPIEPFHVLDIHKALVWRGEPGNTIWGDGITDTGDPIDESFIRVLEYPTPEPSSLVLLCFGAVALVSRVRRLRR